EAIQAGTIRRSEIAALVGLVLADDLVHGLFTLIFGIVRLTVGMLAALGVAVAFVIAILAVMVSAMLAIVVTLRDAIVIAVCANTGTALASLSGVALVVAIGLVVAVFTFMLAVATLAVATVTAA